jgi:hypothetical protein
VIVVGNSWQEAAAPVATGQVCNRPRADAFPDRARALAHCREADARRTRATPSQEAFELKGGGGRFRCDSLKDDCARRGVSVLDERSRDSLLARGLAMKPVDEQVGTGIRFPWTGARNKVRAGGLNDCTRTTHEGALPQV